MATYKKRGHKTVKEEANPVEAQSTTAEVFKSLDERASKTEIWVAKNQRYIITGIAAVVVCVLGYLGYRNLIIAPRIAEANDEIFQAQAFFDEALNGAVDPDSLFRLSLEGGNGKYGFLDIIEEYSGTPAANLATYSAGMAYLNLKEYQQAIDYLEEFSANDPIIASLALGGIGDAFAELNQLEEALDYYEKAFAQNENNFTTPRFLLKAGLIAQELGDNKTAQKYYQQLKDAYPTASESNLIDIRLGEVSN